LSQAPADCAAGAAQPQKSEHKAGYGAGDEARGGAGDCARDGAGARAVRPTCDQVRKSSSLPSSADLSLAGLFPPPPPPPPPSAGRPPPSAPLAPSWSSGSQKTTTLEVERVGSRAERMPGWRAQGRRKHGGRAAVTGNGRIPGTALWGGRVCLQPRSRCLIDYGTASTPASRIYRVFTRSTTGWGRLPAAEETAPLGAAVGGRLLVLEHPPDRPPAVQEAQPVRPRPRKPFPAAAGERQRE
jgi:hypothetical protein